MEEPKSDFPEITQRLDDIELSLQNINSEHTRLETGIINSTVDFCFVNGGAYATDGQGNILVDTVDFVVDGNSGLSETKQVIVCILN